MTKTSSAPTMMDAAREACAELLGCDGFCGGPAAIPEDFLDGFQNEYGEE